MSTIFGKNRVVTESFSVNADEAFVDTTLSGLQSALLESAREAYRLEAGMYVSDIIIEQSVMEGASQEILLEGFVKDTWGKIKELFQKLWAKIKGWFAKVKRQLQLWFQSGAKFVKTFRKEIGAKSTKGFKYEGYKYTFNKGAGWIDQRANTLKAAISNVTAVIINDTQKQVSNQETITRIGASSGHAASHEDWNIEDEKEKLVSSLGGDEMSEVLEEAAKAFRNDEESKEEVEDFSANSKEEMMSFIEDSEKTLREIDNQQKESDAQFNKVLASIEKAQSNLERELKDDQSGLKARVTTLATNRYKFAHYALTLHTQLVGVATAAIKEATSEFERVLKSFLSWKPAKEAFSEFSSNDNGSSDSILESAMRHV